MHYYKFNIHDWQASTRHLTPEEEGVYFRLINYYYDTEKPIPLKTQPVIRRLMLGSHSDIVDQMLCEFFVKTDKGYEKEKCNEVLKDYRKTAKKNKENGLKGGRPRKHSASSVTQSEPSGFPVATQVEPKHNPNQEPLTTNQEPLTKDKKHTSEPEVPTCPHLEIIGLYNSTLKELPPVKPKLWNGARASNLRARWKQDDQHQSLEFWGWLFGKVSESDFLMGRSNGFRADLGWLIKSDNFRKVIEGNYANR